MDLTPYLNKGYKGVVTFSDVHAHADKLKDGIRYAIKNDLFIVFLGDLVDGHDKPLETVIAVKAVLDEGRGVLVIGNHDDKFYRHAIGNKVELKKAQLKTLTDVPQGKEQLFLSTIIDLINHRNSAHLYRYKNWVFTHGATHAEVWDQPAELSRKAKHRALYGEVTGEREADGMPVRIYNWVDEIPGDHTVVVGHDRKPYGGESLSKRGPFTQTNQTGGRAIFTDTGCGKSDDGTLTLTVLLKDGESLTLHGHEAI